MWSTGSEYYLALSTFSVLSLQPPMHQSLSLPLFSSLSLLLGYNLSLLTLNSSYYQNNLRKNELNICFLFFEELLQVLLSH